MRILRFGISMPTSIALRSRPKLVRMVSTFYTVHTPHGLARVPLLKNPQYLGAFSDRCTRPYNEDRCFAGVLKLPRLRAWSTEDARPKRRGPTPGTGEPHGHSSANDTPPLPPLRTPIPNLSNTGNARAPDIEVFCFSLFDGHGGPDCAEYLKSNLAQFVEDQKLDVGVKLARSFRDEFGGYWRAWQTALNRYARRLAASHWEDLEARLPLAYLTADLEFLSQNRKCGSTCTAVYIYALDPSRQFWEPGVESNIITAQVGDSRALLVDNLGNVLPLTTVHHPTSPYESDRLAQFQNAFTVDPDGTSRFLQYANTRAFGDYQGKSYGISAEPELSVHRIRHKHAIGGKMPNAGDGLPIANEKLPGEEAFILIVSDGVTDVAGDQEIGDLVIQTAVRGGPGRNTPQAAATEVVRYVEMLGTDDNATAMVLRLSGWGRWDRWNDRSGQTREDRMNESFMMRRQ